MSSTKECMNQSINQSFDVLFINFTYNYDLVPPSRWRHKGEMILKNKYMLLTVALFCVTECALILGELILDLHKVKGQSHTAQYVYMIIFLIFFFFWVCVCVYGGSSGCGYDGIDGCGYDCVGGCG